MLYSLWQDRLLFQYTILGLSIGLAFWRGASPERYCAGTFLGMLSLDRLYHLVLGPGIAIQNVNLGHLIIDSLATTALLLVALRANRVYPLCLAGLQLVATVAHLAKVISPAVAKAAYDILMVAPSYLQTVVFLVGVVLHLRRQKKYGPYRSWRNS